MPVSENDRLDLRQAFVRSLGSERLAEIAMEAMPPIDWDRFATKADVDVSSRELRSEMAELRAELRGEMAQLRGEMAELRGEMKIGLASNLRLMLVGQLTTTMMLGAWITAVT